SNISVFDRLSRRNGSLSVLVSVAMQIRVILPHYERCALSPRPIGLLPRSGTAGLYGAEG
ncbi:MAG: hypothetical protein Q6K85_11865, partial [Thermostichus sp. DG02_1_bins_55]